MNHNVFDTPAVSQTKAAEDAADLRAVMDDLRDLLEDDEDDYCSDEPAYERTITIEFPPECSSYPGAQSLTVSIRDLLSWCADLGSVNDREKAKRIRDIFYAGDHPDDYETHLFHTDGTCSQEERALARWELEQGQAERRRRKAEFGAEDQQYQSDEKRVWQPFRAEKAALDAVQEAQWDRGDALDREWYEFVSRIKVDTDLSDEWITRRRAELQAKTDQLIDDNDRHLKAYGELRFRTLDYKEKNENAG